MLKFDTDIETKADDHCFIYNTPIWGVDERIERIEESYLEGDETSELSFAERVEVRKAKRLIENLEYLRLCLRVDEALDQDKWTLREKLKFLDEYGGGQTTTALQEDFAPLSFTFSIRNEDGGEVFHGGLIFHGSAPPEEVRKHQKNPEKIREIVDFKTGWSIHT